MTVLDDYQGVALALGPWQRLGEAVEVVALDDHVTGDDAIRMANAANAEIGALRALPPGRSGR